MGPFLLRAGALLLVYSSAIAATYPDPASLARDLRSLSQSLQQNPEQPPAVPANWQVQTPDGTYSISSAPLQNFLKSPFQKRQAEIWLDHLAGQLENSSSPIPNLNRSRETLNRILAQPEFAGDRPPNALERFLDRVLTAISDWLNRIFHMIGGQSSVGAALLFVLIIFLALLILFLVFHHEKKGLTLNLQSYAAPLAARNWEQWLLFAREAADRGDLRTAIQCSYWSGISRLQESGALPSDLTRTPREYLRLLAKPSSFTFALQTLTLHMETFWYGPGTATPSNLSACFESLEALGCRIR